MTTNIVIMAAGKGTRMNSDLPKVLHPVFGVPMIQHVLWATELLVPEQIIVVTGYGAPLVEDFVRDQYPIASDIFFARQERQLGTGHAVQQALPLLTPEGVTVVLNGDVPFVNHRTLARMVERARDRLVLLAAKLENPTGYGRILKEQGRVIGIVEEKDATPLQREIKEIYTGTLACPNSLLQQLLPKLTNDNAQGEFYLTDIVGLARRANQAVELEFPEALKEVIGVNSPAQLQELEQLVRYGLPVTT